MNSAGDSFWGQLLILRFTCYSFFQNSEPFRLPARFLVPGGCCKTEILHKYHWLNLWRKMPTFSRKWHNYYLCGFSWALDNGWYLCISRILQQPPKKSLFGGRILRIKTIERTLFIRKINHFSFHPKEGILKRLVPWPQRVQGSGGSAPYALTFYL